MDTRLADGTRRSPVEKNAHESFAWEAQNCEFPNYLAEWSGTAPVISQPLTGRHKSVTTSFAQNHTPFIVESHSCEF
jgi:hypothetical protein